MPVNKPRLWVDERHNMLYRWGGMGSDVGENAISSIYQRDEEAPIWRFEPDGEGGGMWEAAGAPSTSGSHGSYDASNIYTVAVGGGATCVSGGYASKNTNARLHCTLMLQPGMLISIVATGKRGDRTTDTLIWHVS